MKVQQIYIILFLFIYSFSLQAQQEDEMAGRKNTFYEIKDVPIPDEVLLEVGGLAFTEEGKLGVTTRRGELWLIEDPASSKPKYSLFASGMHEPLWLSYRNGSFYTTQRGELTKITDTNNDGKGDLFKTIYAWPLSGNYHEYSYGPLFMPNGDMIVTLNVSWEGKGKSLAKWRGWMLRITEDGKMEPYATGLRSPAGIGLNAEGDLFYSENQGDWIGSGFVTHVEKGDFTGHPAGLRWAGEPNSPIGIPEYLYRDSIGTIFEFSKSISSVKVPSVWFPHTILGVSTSGMVTIENDEFGPYKGQMLVGDQGHSKIMRMFLEKVNGEYQGACFPFKEGFESGILRLAWGNDNSLYVGMTSRGWASTGEKEYGLQRLVWNGKTPFEMKAIRAVPDGFEIEYTQPVDSGSASDLNAYQITGFTYSYHKGYGSPIIQQKKCPVVKTELSADGRKVRLYVQGLRRGFVHEVKAGGVKSKEGKPLLHNVGYYTLNNMPEGSGHAGHMMAGEVNSPDEQARSCGADPTKNIKTRPASWTNGPDVVIKIGTVPGLKFDIEEFEIPAGSKVQLVLNNNDDMLHNLVITTPGAGDKVGKMAMEMGLDGPALGFVPASEDVLFNTCVIEPETSQSLFFVAPEKEGDYTYVCTFPGHYFNMRGIMKVVSGPSVSQAK